MKDAIFKQFTFKYITASSSSNKILKEIYNTYFGKHVIESKYGDNKNVEYEINDAVHRYFEFAKTNLRIDKPIRIVDEQDDIEGFVI